MSFAVFFIFNKGLRQSLSLFANFVQGEHSAQLADEVLPIFRTTFGHFLIEFLS